MEGRSQSRSMTQSSLFCRAPAGEFQDTRYKQVPSTNSRRDQENQAAPLNLGDLAHFASLSLVSLDPGISRFLRLELAIWNLFVSCILCLCIYVKLYPGIYVKVNQ